MQLPKLRRRKKVKELGVDPWPIRDRFVQNLFDSLYVPIWLAYVDAKSVEFKGSRRQYKGGRIAMPHLERRWRKATHVGVIIDGEIKSVFRITPELPMVTWQVSAEESLSKLKVKLARSVVASALGKIKNPFR